MVEGDRPVRRRVRRWVGRRWWFWRRLWRLRWIRWRPQRWRRWWRVLGDDWRLMMRSAAMTWIRKAGLAVGLALVVLGSTGCSYNTFVGQEEGIKAQWAQVENQLQRRNDLIPNLVATVQGTAAQQQTVFKEIADSRAKLAGAKTPDEKMD